LIVTAITTTYLNDDKYTKDKMKAFILRTTGKPKVLRISEIEPPQISQPQDIIVRVKYIGLNYAEVLSRKGQYSWTPPRPYVPGMECFGVVEEVGEEVSHVKVGDQVVVGGQYGSYAEKVKAKQHLVFKALDFLNEKENAALLVNYMTAWVALMKQARISEGETVLVQAAAGGVGTAAVQIGKAAGAIVIGTAGKDQKCQLVKNLGADLAINYINQDFYAIVKEQYNGVDAVLESWWRSLLKKPKIVTAIW